MLDASVFAEDICNELVSIASVMETPGTILQSVDPKNVPFLDVLIESEMKLVSHMWPSNQPFEAHCSSGYWKFCCANIHNRALERWFVRLARVPNVSLFVRLCSCSTTVVHFLITLKQQIQQNPNCQIWMLFDFPHLLYGDTSVDSVHANLPNLPRKPWLILE